MKIAIVAISILLCACGATSPRIAKKDACQRSPYCASYDPAGKTEDRIEADLRSVREAVQASPQ